MKRILIIPATLALLTGLPAAAQELNDNSAAIKSPVAVLYSADEADQAQLDEMSIDELNALQLQRLQVAAPDMSAEADGIFQVATAPEMTTAPDDGSSMSDMDMTADAAIDTPMTDEMASVESTMEMGGPAYASEADAMNHAEMPGTIAEVAMGDARFTTLMSLVEQAGLDQALAGEGPFTVFAPTNAAFERLDPDLVARLTSGEANEELATLLKSHVVEGEYLAADIQEGETDLTTLASTTVDIERTGDAVTADDIDVITADIDASNGVIHAIDSVIMPIAQGDTDMSDETETEGQ